MTLMMLMLMLMFYGDVDVGDEDDVYDVYHKEYDDEGYEEYDKRLVFMYMCISMLMLRINYDEDCCDDKHDDDDDADDDEDGEDYADYASGYDVYNDVDENIDVDVNVGAGAITDGDVEDYADNEAYENIDVCVDVMFEFDVDSNDD